MGEKGANHWILCEFGVVAKKGVSEAKDKILQPSLVTEVVAMESNSKR